MNMIFAFIGLQYCLTGIKQFISEHTVAAAIIGAIAAVAAPVMAFILPYNSKKAQARRKCGRESLKAVASITDERVFFDSSLRAENNPRNFFYKGISLNNENGKPVSIKELKNSYVIRGASGCGKSAIVKYMFLNTHIQRRFLRSTLVLYFDASKLKNTLENNTEFLNRFIEARYKRLYLFLDGIDESLLSEDYEKLKELLNKISLHVDFLNIVISCRNENYYSVEKHLKNEYQLREYEIDEWSKEQAVDYIKTLVALVSEDDDSKESLENFMLHDELLKAIKYNPLLAKMLISIRTKKENYTFTDNKYEFYSEFLRTLTMEHSSDGHEIASFKNNLDKNSEFIYKSYIQNVRNREFKDIPYFDSIIMKENLNDLKVFRHESFFEFMIACYVGNRILNISSETIDALSYEFPNAISDFVSERLKSESDNDKIKIRDNLIALYSLTIDKDDDLIRYKEKFENLFPAGLELNNYKEIIRKLDDKRFFTFKYEIIFRIGRLLLFDEKVNEFLKYTYNDTNIARDPIDKDILEKWEIVMKRGCAVSASFVGYEELEIDYVKHMLSYLSDYNELYDKINRSHTLIFYGDVRMERDSILDFLELMDDGERECKKSCEKRLKRLSKLKDCTKSVSEMNEKEKRLFYFRLFDIATLYSFIKSRNSTKQLAWLNKENREIIKDFRTEFEGMSEERKKLLNEIKENTIGLIKARHLDQSA